jgi:hypothetical protein
VFGVCVGFVFGFIFGTFTMAVLNIAGSCDEEDKEHTPIRPSDRSSK